MTPFLLTDITVVGVAEQHHDEEKQNHIALALVVKSVGLVPFRERS